MSDSVRPHRRQPNRLCRPWDSPGKNTGVGCHFLLQCRKVKSESEVAQSCLTLPGLMDCSLPGSSVHGVFRARVLDWSATAFSKHAVSFKIPRHVSQNRRKNSITCIKLLLLFSCQVTSDSYWLHRLHHARLPCSLTSPRICPSSCPLNRWCHPTNSSSVTLFIFYLQSFLASGSFPMSQLFTLGAQSIGDLASASVLLKSIWGWFSLRLTGSISLVPRDSQESSTAPLFENISSSALCLLYCLSSSYMRTWLLERA